MFSVKISLGTHFAEIKKEVKKMCNNIFYTEKKKKPLALLVNPKSYIWCFRKHQIFNRLLVIPIITKKLSE